GTGGRGGAGGGTATDRASSSRSRRGSTRDTKTNWLSDGTSRRGRFQGGAATATSRRGRRSWLDSVRAWAKQPSFYSTGQRPATENPTTIPAWKSGAPLGRTHRLVPSAPSVKENFGNADGDLRRMDQVAHDSLVARVGL